MLDLMLLEVFWYDNENVQQDRAQGEKNGLN
jgi:hypothetical protein